MTTVYALEFRLRREDRSWGPWVPTRLVGDEERRQKWEQCYTVLNDEYQQYRITRYVPAPDDLQDAVLPAEGGYVTRLHQRIADLERALAEARAREGT